MTETEAEKTLPKVKRAEKPLVGTYRKSTISIESALKKADDIPAEKKAEPEQKQLPESHFTETDLKTEWQKFLEGIRADKPLVYNAISGFILNKTGEKEIAVHYASEFSRGEFQKVSEDFFNHFRHKVNNFVFSVKYVRDEVNLKREIMTKRKIFDRLVTLNPLLKDLDDIMHFDLD